MKAVFKILVVFLTIGIATLTNACSDDDKAPPIISYPDNGTLYEVKVGESLPFNFTVVAEGGYASHQLQGIAGNIITDTSTPADGSKNFSISGLFLAGDVAGPGGIKLTVTDNEGATAVETIGVDILND